MRKKFLKFASVLCAALFVGAMATFTGADVASQYAHAEITQGATDTMSDVENCLLNDKGTELSTSYTNVSGVNEATRSDVMRFNLQEREYLLLNAYQDPVTVCKNNIVDNVYGGALVVEFDMWLNNVEAANFGFVYGQSSTALRMDRLSANNISFYGVNSLFYGTLENDSRIHNAAGEYPIAYRWTEWSKSAKTTIYIHPSGRQEVYQDDKLIAYTTVDDMNLMSWIIYNATYVENGGVMGVADPAAEYPAAVAAATADRNTFLQNTMSSFLANNGNDTLEGYCGFVYRPTDGSGDSLDLTLRSLRVGYVSEDWFYTDGYHVTADDSGEYGPDGWANGKPRSTNPFPTNNTTGADPSGSVIWTSNAYSGTHGSVSGMTNTGFKLFNRSDVDISSTVNAYTGYLPGWVFPDSSDHGYYGGDGLTMTTTVELPDCNYEMGGQRYAMIDIATWLAGLGYGQFTVQVGNIKLVIQLATQVHGSVEKTLNYMYLYDGDEPLTDTETGATYVPIKIYDHALLRLSFWGHSGVSVSYNRLDGSIIQSYEYNVTTTSGKTAGPVTLSLKGSTVKRCFFDNIKVYEFTPYVEEFDDTTYQNWSVAGSSTVEDGMFHATTRTTIVSDEKYKNFVLSFDSPFRAEGSTWLGVVFGMENQTDTYADSNVLFMYMSTEGQVIFSPGGQESTSLIDGGDSVALQIPTNIGTEEEPKYPAALIYTSPAASTKEKIGCNDRNIHIEIVVVNNVMRMYHQIDGYEKVLTFESVDLSAYLDQQDGGYVSIQTTTVPDLYIDNLSILTASRVKTVAINTFVDIDGNLYETTVTDRSLSNALDRNFDDIAPLTNPEIDGYTFVGWMDNCSGVLVASTEMICNHGGRVMSPMYVKAHSNSMTTDSTITLDFYLEYKSALDDRGNRLVVEFKEYDAPSGGNVVDTELQISTDDDIDEIVIADDGTIWQKAEAEAAGVTGARGYTFHYAQDPKDYLNQVSLEIRVGGLDYFVPVNARNEKPWANYSLETYLKAVAQVGVSIEEQSTSADDAYAQEAKVYKDYACAMAMFFDATRQYFDDNIEEISADNFIENTHASRYVETFNAHQAQDGLELFKDNRLRGSGTKPAGLRLMGLTVVFELGMTTRLNFQIYSGDYQFTWANGDEINGSHLVRRVNSDGDVYYYIELPRVGGKDIDMAHEVVITETSTGESISLTFSALTYAEMAFSQGASAKTQALVKTLDAYRQSCLNWHNYMYGQ